MHLLKHVLNSVKLILTSILVQTLLSACLSCSPSADLRDFADADLFPPVIKTILPVDEYTVILEFNETVELNQSPLINPALGESIVSIEDNCLIMEFTKKQQAGTRYVLDAEVSDTTGNRMSFLMPFYGFNPNPPSLLINEFTCQGSTSHPDIVELFVIEGGNLAGLWVVEGTSDYPEESICFPALEVECGEYILVHFKPQGIADEINETSDDIAASGGHDASPSARDFWVEGGGGLSGNNGVIAVYNSPGGKLMDAVLYSNRTSSSDEKYLGFGSTKMLNKAVQIVNEGGWNATGDEGKPRPEDGIDPEDSTATRSICRASEPSDNNSKADWHIVPTSNSSFGEINIDDEY